MHVYKEILKVKFNVFRFFHNFDILKNEIYESKKDIL